LFHYLLKRLVLMAVTLFGIIVITFVLTRLTPGEPGGMQQNMARQEGVSYDDLIEQNRRNLGLDKPLLVNLGFDDRETAALQAVRDYIRRAYFWQRDAERRLALSSTIAIAPALDVLDRLAENPEGVDHFFEPEANVDKQIDAPDARRRLLEFMPTLAQHKEPGLADRPLDEQQAFWKAWYEENRARWSDENVADAAARYLAGEADQAELLALGGYAVPHMIEGLKSPDTAASERANAALTGLTGLNFLSTPNAWAAEKREVIPRWRSFYSRERVRYSVFGPVRQAVNIVLNTQFGTWMSQVVRFDFGDSYKHRRPVIRLLLERIPVTLLLSGLSIFLSYLIAIPLGIYSAVKRDTLGDRASTLTLFILYSLPTFWAAQMLLMALTGGPSPIPGVEWPDLFPTRGLNSEGLDWRNPSGMADFVDLLHHLVLPTLVMTYGSLAFLSRQMRSAMLETINQDYVRTAVAKGLRPRTVIFKHVLRNSLIPIITLSAGLLPTLIAGSIVVEQIFTIQGMGLLSFEAILNRDYPVINAVLFFSAFLTLLGILLADLSYALVDPRISYE